MDPLTGNFLQVQLFQSQERDRLGPRSRRAAPIEGRTIA